MEIQFSKQDKAIEEGASALRNMAVDTSNMARVLNPRPRRSLVLPVGLATAVACAAGAIVLLAPAKATASPFQKVKEAVLKQAAVHERVFQRGKGDLWEVRLETYKDDTKRGVKWGKAEGGYQYLITEGKKYEKWPDKADVKISFIVQEDGVVEGRPPESAIHEILAREGMEFLGIQRSQKRDGRACDIYRLNFQNEPNDLLYYVDPKTDLPFLQEVVDKDGKVIDKVEIEFPVQVRIRFVDGVELKEGQYQIEIDAEVDLFEVKSDGRVTNKKGSKSSAPITLEGVPLNLKKN